MPYVHMTSEIFAEICRRISEGESVREMLDVRKESSLPGRWTFYNYLANNATEDERRLYAVALRALADHHLESALAIAMAPAALKQDGSVDGGDIARRRLIWDAKRWHASKLYPKAYGDRVELSGEEGGKGQVVIAWGLKTESQDDKPSADAPA